MPNWCDNYLIVSGKDSDVQNFVEENHSRSGEHRPRKLTESAEPALLFSRSVPEPDYQNIEKQVDRASWRFSNWGTPEEALFRGNIPFSTTQNNQVTVAEYYFETAWGPSDQWVERVAKKYPKLKFCLTFGDMDQDFGGVIIFESGDKVEETNGSYNQYLAKEIYNYL